MRPNHFLLSALSVTFREWCVADAFAEHGVRINRGTFSCAECEAIVALMKKRPAERDVRPSESVSRVNYFDATEHRISEGTGSCPYDWIYARILERAKEGGNEVQWGFDIQTATVAEFSRHTDFILMHEFKGSDFFDWHTDTKPGDETGEALIPLYRTIMPAFRFVCVCGL